MKTNQRLSRFVFTTLTAIAVMMLFSLNAFAISNPGLDFEHEFRPAPQEFPASLKASDPAVFQAHQSLLHFPEDLQKLENQNYAKELAILNDKTIDNTTKQDKLGEERLNYKASVKKLKAEKAEMRKTFLILATDKLKNDADPHIMLSVAQQYYDLRNQNSSVMKKAMLAVTQEKAAAVEEKKDAKGAEVKTEVKEEVKAPTGNPSKAILSDYKSNLDLVIMLCKEIQQRFTSFDHLADTYLLLAAAYNEKNQKAVAAQMWESFLAKYKGNENTGVVLYQLANYEYKSTTSFDHYTTASETYAKALKHFKPGKEKWRVMYKYAWATYLSPDLSEDSKAIFIRLYKEMKAQKNMSEEMMLIKVEILEVIRQISGTGQSANSGSMFGK